MLLCVLYTKKKICHLFLIIVQFLSCSFFEKVAERNVFKHLYNHLHENSILTPLQSGFIYPTDQLNYLYDTLSHALDSGKEIRVIFCDISQCKIGVKYPVLP